MADEQVFCRRYIRKAAFTTLRRVFNVGSYVIVYDQGHRDLGIPANSREFGFCKITAEIPGIFFPSLNLDYLSYALILRLNTLNAKQWYFVT